MSDPLVNCVQIPNVNRYDPILIDRCTKMNNETIRYKIINDAIHLMIYATHTHANGLILVHV